MSIAAITSCSYVENYFGSSIDNRHFPFYRGVSCVSLLASRSRRSRTFRLLFNLFCLNNTNPAIFFAILPSDLYSARETFRRIPIVYTLWPSPRPTEFVIDNLFWRRSMIHNIVICHRYVI